MRISRRLAALVLAGFATVGIGSAAAQAATTHAGSHPATTHAAVHPASAVHLGPGAAGHRMGADDVDWWW